LLQSGVVAFARRLLLLRLWQFIDLVRCNVDLNGVANAVELIIEDGNHVGAETEKATDFDCDQLSWRSRLDRTGHEPGVMLSVRA